MFTYQDLLRCGNNEELRIQFIENLISAHKDAPQYKIAKKAKAYYRHENPDIAIVEKVIYDFRGIAHTDVTSPNHKLMNAYYPLIIDMGTSHLLANGIAFENEEVKARLGSNFDKTIKDILNDARNSGVSYGYYNGEKLVHFKYEEFAELLDEETGALSAGVRYWQIDADKPLIATLYEPDGYTEYIKPKGEEMRLREHNGRSGKQRYGASGYQNDLQGIYELDSGVESIMPIYPLYNLQKQSAIQGNIAILAAIDLINSGLINNISEGDLIYWILQGYGGMDEVDDTNFLVHMMKNHIVHTDQEGQTITPHQVTVQFAANESGAVRLKKMLFDNMRGVMTESLSAGNLTATAINSAYSAQRLNSGLLEDEVREFLQGIFRIVGIPEDEKISFSYYETVNPSESINNVIASAQWLGDKVTTRLLASLHGVIDDLETIEADKAADELARMGLNVTAMQNEENPAESE